jgi:hypothetical protein
VQRHATPVARQHVQLALEAQRGRAIPRTHGFLPRGAQFAALGVGQTRQNHQPVVLPVLAAVYADLIRPGLPETRIDPGFGADEIAIGALQRRGHLVAELQAEGWLRAVAANLDPFQAQGPRLQLILGQAFHLGPQPRVRAIAQRGPVHRQQVGIVEAPVFLHRGAQPAQGPEALAVGAGHRIGLVCGADRLLPVPGTDRVPGLRLPVAEPCGPREQQPPQVHRPPAVADPGEDCCRVGDLLPILRIHAAGYLFRQTRPVARGGIGHPPRQVVRTGG